MYKYLAFVLFCFLFLFVFVPSTVHAAVITQSTPTTGGMGVSTTKTLIQTLGSGLSGKVSTFVFRSSGTSTLPTSTITFYDQTSSTSYSSCGVTRVDNAPSNSEYTVDLSCNNIMLNSTHSYLFYITSSSYLPSFLYSSTGNVYTNGSVYWSGSSRTISDCLTNCSNIVNGDMYFVLNGITSSTVSYSNFTEDALTNTATMDLTGVILYTPLTSTMECEVDLLRKSSGSSSYASSYSVTPDAHIKLFVDDGATSTKDLGGGYYDGYGLTSPNGTTWYAKGIKLPYDPKYTTNQYTNSTTCYDTPLNTWVDSNGVSHTSYGASTVVYSDSSDTTNSLLLAPSELNATSSATTTAPAPSDPIAWLAWKFQNILTALFIPSNFDYSVFGLIQNELWQRVPFAYIHPIFSISYTSPGGSTSAPTITLPFTEHARAGIPSSITWSGDSGISGTLSAAKTFIAIICWTSLFAYIFLMIRRII